MGIQVGTIFKWYSPDIEDENCEDGQCVGIVQKLAEPDDTTKLVVKSVIWWQLCPKHMDIDPDGTGPYLLDCIWQIGQLY